MTITAMRNAITAKIIAETIEKLENAGIEYFRTGENMNTFTFEAGEINGEPVYGSFKFTLHKDNFDLDEAVEAFEMFNEEKVRKAKEKEERDAKKAKEKAEREAKIAARKAEKENKASSAAGNVENEPIVEKIED